MRPLLLLILLLPACNSVDRDVIQYDGRVVSVRTVEGSEGVGVVVGKNSIWTAEHVTKKADMVYVDGKEANYCGYIKREPEDILLYSVDKEYKKHEVFPLGKGTPAWVISIHNIQPYNDAMIFPGYSGAAVVDKNFRLVGILSGYQPEATIHRSIRKVYRGTRQVLIYTRIYP